MPLDGPRPFVALHAVFEERDVFPAAAALDQVFGKRVALGVQGHDVARVLAHGEHLVEGDAPPGAEELHEHRAMLGPFAVVFDAGAPPSSAQRGKGRRKWLA